MDMHPDVEKSVIAIVAIRVILIGPFMVVKR
jgi:hypothetical protein